MFSVPGWNVSAPIATQIEVPKPKDPNKLGKKALKRKQKQEQQVNAENVGELWEKVAGAESSNQDQASSTKSDNAEKTTDGAQELRGKKRKRVKSSKDRPKDEEKDDEADIPSPSVSQSRVSEPGPSATSTSTKRDQKKRKKDVQPESIPSKPKPLTTLIPEPPNLTPLQKSMRQKLASARFRHLNESLYTKPSEDSLSLFRDDPSMFEDYHRGFAQQVEVWPQNPVDEYVQSIMVRGKLGLRGRDKKRREQQNANSNDKDVPSSIGVAGNSKPLPRTHGHCTIADLGCGTASLSYRLQSHLKPLALTLHSFDLSRPTGPSAPLVTVADIANLPLQDGSVSVAIFCLALMGTNWLDFIDEAYRILHWKGELWVSEIKSRFGRVERRNKVPINSIGSLRKADKKPPKKSKKDGDKPEEEGPQDSADEAELAERVDGVEGKEGTDVSAFVEVLKKRGFLLDALPERQSDAIDLGNKMFVKMQFVKGAPAVRGKNTKKEEAKGGSLKFGMKGKKFNFIAEAEDMDDEKEKGVLKPCLYKIR